MMNSYSFSLTINLPTRITPTSATLIDNIFINKLSYKFDVANVYSDVSDHLPVIMHLCTAVEKNKKVDVLNKRIYTEQLICSFKETLSEMDWSDICYNVQSNCNVTNLFSTFSQRFQSVFEHFFPLQVVRSSKQDTPQQIWMTKGLVTSCKKKSKLYRRYLKKPTSENKRKYTEYRSKLKSLLKKAKLKYYEDKFKLAYGNLHDTWKILNNILEKKSFSNYVTNFTKDGIIINTPKEVALRFNEYFTGISQVILLTMENMPWVSL